MTGTFLCMSDLHLGAKESLLSNYDDKKLRVSDDPGEVISTLAPALRATVAAISPKEPVRLVLLGDVLDLGLSGMGDVSRNLLHLLNALFPSAHEGDTAPFAGDRVYSRQSRPPRVAHGAGRAICRPGQAHPRTAPTGYPQITPIAEKAFLRLPPRNSTHETRASLSKSVCRVAYPNWAVRNSSGTRAVVMHHGHYLDPTYMALCGLPSGLPDPGGP
jgi:hypothetical protein